MKQSCCFTSSSSVPERSLMLENELASGDNGARLLHPSQSMLVLLMWKECYPFSCGFDFDMDVNMVSMLSSQLLL